MLLAQETDSLCRILISFTVPFEAEQRWLNMKLRVELKLWKYLDAERPLICSDGNFYLPFKRYIQTFNFFLQKYVLKKFTRKIKDYFI